MLLSMASSSRPRTNHLNLTHHARIRLSERGLWPALGHIARIAYHPGAPRFADLSADGRRVERIEVDGICIIVARQHRARHLTLLTVHSGSDNGAFACNRIATVSRNLAKSRSA